MHIAWNLDGIYYNDANGVKKQLDANSAGYWMATDIGFKGSSYPSREHPLSTISDLTSGVAKQEQFADMLMNMILQDQPGFPENGFTDDPAGIARLKYIRDQQIPWVLSASGGGQ